MTMRESFDSRLLRWGGFLMALLISGAFATIA